MSSEINRNKCLINVRKCLEIRYRLYIFFFLSQNYRFNSGFLFRIPLFRKWGRYVSYPDCPHIIILEHSVHFCRCRIGHLLQYQGFLIILLCKGQKKNRFFCRGALNSGGGGEVRLVSRLPASMYAIILGHSVNFVVVDIEHLFIGRDF